MSFESFDSAVAEYKAILKDNDLPTSLLWLTRSRVRCNRTSLYVFRPSDLVDSGPHRARFDLALRLDKNIAFCLHAVYQGRSMVGLETMGLDSRYADSKQSGSHNYQILESRLQLYVVESILRWQITKALVRNTHPMWTCLGWPP